MLRVFPNPDNLTGGKQAELCRNAIWIDLVDPTEDETKSVEAMTGLSLPSINDLSEIEASSRLRNHEEVLYMSMPSAAPHPADQFVTPPIGFLLSHDRLITIRFMPLAAFDNAAAQFGKEQEAPQSSLEMFALLAENIVDILADALEHLASELNKLSVKTFKADDARGRHPAHANRLLRTQLNKLGLVGDKLSDIRDALQGLGRAAAHTQLHAGDWIEGSLQPRLEGIGRDIHSLVEYEEQLANKVQFVLDALVGLIGIAQNDIFKVLTIVSIVGIPPTLMAGVYGMNFKSMPEYDWAWGYAWGWAVIIISAIIPIVWFKIRGWF